MWILSWAAEFAWGAAAARDRTELEGEEKRWLLYTAAEILVQNARDHHLSTFLAAVYSNESSPQRRVKGTKNGCTPDTQRA